GDLLTQRVQRRQSLTTILASIKPDIISDPVRRPEADDRARVEPFLVDDPLKHRLSIAEQLPRDLTLLFILKDARVDALQFPGLEEWSPVDIARDFGQIEIVDHPGAQEFGGPGLIARPVDLQRIIARGRQRQTFLVSLS